MEFRFTEEQLMFRDTVRALAKRYFAERAFTWEEGEGEYPWAHARILAENGLLGMRLSSAEGGQDATLMDCVIAIQEITKVCPHTGDVFQAGNFGAIQQVARWASPELRAAVLPPLLRGETIITAAMTEPNAGSAVTDLRTTARFVGDEVVINGSKVFNSHGDEAGYFCVWCRFGSDARSAGAVVVPQSAPGFSRGRVERYMSGEHNVSLFFDDCRVPKSHVLVAHDGFRQLLPVFNVERLGNASRALAVAELAFDLAVGHAAQRVQFGRPICEFQGIQWMLADMKVRLEQSRWLLYKAVVEADQGLPDALASAMAKLSCNETAEYVCRHAIQIHGGYGISREYPLAYLYERARGWMVAGGTVEMMRNRIASGIFGRPFSQRGLKGRAEQDSVE